MDELKALTRDDRTQLVPFHSLNRVGTHDTPFHLSTFARRLPPIASPVPIPEPVAVLSLMVTWVTDWVPIPVPVATRTRTTIREAVADPVPVPVATLTLMNAPVAA